MFAFSADNSKYLRILGSGDSSYSKCMELKIFTISLLSRLFVLCLQGKPSETRNLFDCRRIRMLSRNLSARIPELGGACWLARWRAVLQQLGGGGRVYRVYSRVARTWHFPHHQAATWVKDGSAGELQESLESRIFIQTSRMVSDSPPEPKYNIDFFFSPRKRFYVENRSLHVNLFSKLLE